jgi:glycosyltransferase involved in cell wall biosynthesis
MTAPDHAPEPKKALAPAGPSTHDGSGINPAPDRIGPSFLIGFVGNCFYRPKGMDLLADAFRIVVAKRAIKLAILGDGPGLLQFRSHISDAGIAEHVCFLGRVANAWQYMRSLDLLVAPSRLDNCPNVVFEALAANVPIVATRIDAHEYILGPDAPQLVSCERHEIADRTTICPTRFWSLCC